MAVAQTFPLRGNYSAVLDMFFKSVLCACRVPQQLLRHHWCAILVRPHQLSQRMKTSALACGYLCVLAGAKHSLCRCSPWVEHQWSQRCAFSPFQLSTAACLLCSFACAVWRQPYDDLLLTRTNRGHEQHVDDAHVYGRRDFEHVSFAFPGRLPWHMPTLALFSPAALCP